MARQENRRWLLSRTAGWSSACCVAGRLGWLAVVIVLCPIGFGLACWGEDLTSTGSLSRATVETLPAGWVDTWVRIQWTADQPTPWHVRVSIEPGENGALPQASLERLRIVAVENHHTSDESTGAIFVTPDRAQVQIDLDEASVGGTIRVRVQAPSDSSFVCQAIAGETVQGETSVSLTDLLSGTPHHATSSPSGPANVSVAWDLSRTVDEAIKIVLPKESPTYWEDDVVSCGVEVHHLAIARNKRVSLKCVLVNAENGSVVADHSFVIPLDDQGCGARNEFPIPHPLPPGVYELRATLESDEVPLWDKVRGRRALVAVSGKPVLVMARQLEPVDAGGWTTVGCIHPAAARSWNLSSVVPVTRNALMSSIPGMSEPSLGRAVHEGEPVSELRPGETCEFKLPTAMATEPHLITLRYPSGTGTRYRIEIRSVTKPLQPLKSFVFREESPVLDSLAWGRHSFVHYPTGQTETIHITNLETNQAARFHSITVTTRGKTLVAKHGVDNDATLITYALPDFGWVDQFTPDIDSHAGFSRLLPETQSLYRLSLATDRLADYVRASGMNSIVLPVNQGGRTWFGSSQFSPQYREPRESAGQLETVLRTMDRAGLKVILGLNPSIRLTSLERLMRDDASAAVELLRSNRFRRGERVYNPLDSRVEAALASVVRDVATCCESHPSFAGISLNCMGASHLYPFRGEDSFPPSVLAEFAKHASAESRAAAGTFDSLSQIDAYRQGDGKRVMESWLVARQRALLSRLAVVCGERLLVRLPAQTHSLAVAESLATSRATMDGPAVCPVYAYQRMTFGSLSQQRAAYNELNSLPVRTSKGSHLALSIGEHLARDGSPVSIMSDELVSDLGRLVDRLHPDLVLVESSATTASLAFDLSRAFRSLAQTPLHRIAGVRTSDEAGQAARLYKRDDERLPRTTLAINVAPWKSELEVISPSGASWMISPETIAIEEHAFGEGLAKASEPESRRELIQLNPGRIQLLQAAGGGAGTEIIDWMSRPVDGEAGLARIKAALTTIVERLGSFSESRDYPTLTNGSFENSSETGITGWLSAQHPPGAVQVVSIATAGARSACLTMEPNATARTWLVSEMIPVPESGRLAVALAYRAEPQGIAGDESRASSSHISQAKIRVAIEGTRRDEPVRFATELDIIRDGSWHSRRIVLEVDSLDPRETHSLRLAIDSLLPGKVFIDDVHLYDWFPLQSERNELQGQSFLAVQGLQRGNLAPAARLIRNDWARYLLSVGPTQVTTQQREPEAAAAQPPGMAERLKSWLPRPLRF